MELPDFLHRDEFGELFLAGHRVSLYHVLTPYRNGASPEAIAQLFPTLPLFLIHKAIAFYLEHRSTLDDHLHDIERDLTEQAETPPFGPSFEELRHRMAAVLPARSA